MYTDIRIPERQPVRLLSLRDWTPEGQMARAGSPPIYLSTPDQVHDISMHLLPEKRRAQLGTQQLIGGKPLWSNSAGGTEALRDDYDAIRLLLLVHHDKKVSNVRPTVLTARHAHRVTR